MHGPPLKPDVVAFGAYEIHLTTHELFKHGARIRLAPQAFHVLRMLLDSGGNLVTREQFHRALWPADTFVDFDHGLNNAIKKIRDVLNDSAESPRYIETLPRLGYRFIAPLNGYSETVAVETETAFVEIEATGKSAPVPGSLNPQEAGEFNNSAGRVLQRRWAPRWTIIGAVGVLAYLTVAGVWFRGRTAKSAAQPAIKSIAVLPLKNLSGDPLQEYLTDGMTEELIGRLAAIHDLRVISRTSAMQFKDTKMSAPEIAKALHVDALVEGSVIRAGNRIRVHAQLIRGATDEHLWSEEYDRDLKDVLALQSDVAQAIAGKVAVTVTGSERARLVAKRQVSPEAYESNLKGEFVLGRRTNSRADVERSIAYFQDAIERDPSFAQAYVGLGYAYDTLDTATYAGDPQKMLTNALTAAQKALELDPELVDAHLLLAEIRQKQYQWTEAESEYKRAIELGPNSPETHFDYAFLLSLQGRVDEAMAGLKRASELDPPVTGSGGAGDLLLYARRYDEALSEYRDLLALESDDVGALQGIGLVLMAKHQPEQAVPVLEKAVSVSNQSPGMVGYLVMAYAQAGRRTDALRLLAELKKHEQPGYSGAFVIAYLGLGDYDQAFAWLNRAYQEHANIMQYLKVLFLFDPVRGDPRFADLLRRVGLN